MKFKTILIFIPFFMYLVYADNDVIRQSVTARSIQNIEGVGFNEGNAGGLNWESPDDLKELELTINAPTGRTIKGTSVTDLGQLWHPPSNNDQCTNSKVWTSAPIRARDRFKGYFNGIFCSGGKGKGKPPQWATGVYMVDIDADANNDSEIFQRPPTLTGDEADEEDYHEQAPTIDEIKYPGLLVCVNDGFHEGGDSEDPKRKDFEKPGITNSDPDLVTSNLGFKFDEVFKDLEATITYPQNINLYLKLNHNVSILIPTGSKYKVKESVELNNDGTIKALGKNNTLLIEGISASQNVGSSKIAVRLKQPNRTGFSEDELNMTVFKINSISMYPTNNVNNVLETHYTNRTPPLFPRNIEGEELFISKRRFILVPLIYSNRTRAVVRFQTDITPTGINGITVKAKSSENEENQQLSALGFTNFNLRPTTVQPGNKVFDKYWDFYITKPSLKTNPDLISTVYFFNKHDWDGEKNHLLIIRNIAYNLDFKAIYTILNIYANSNPDVAPKTDYHYNTKTKINIISTDDRLSHSVGADWETNKRIYKYIWDEGTPFTKALAKDPAIVNLIIEEGQSMFNTLKNGTKGQKIPYLHSRDNTGNNDNIFFNGSDDLIYSILAARTTTDLEGMFEIVDPNASVNGVPAVEVKATVQVVINDLIDYDFFVNSDNWKGRLSSKPASVTQAGWEEYDGGFQGSGKVFEVEFKINHNYYTDNDNNEKITFFITEETEEEE